LDLPKSFEWTSTHLTETCNAGPHKRDLNFQRTRI
jgi:hypothetical protein